jgi:hypothetical protein
MRKRAITIGILKKSEYSEKFSLPAFYGIIIVVKINGSAIRGVAAREYL